MEKDYIIAPERIIRKLDDAEQASVAINGLMEDVIDPAFYGYRCCGLLDDWSQETGGDKGRLCVGWRNTLMRYMRPAIRSICLQPKLLVIFKQFYVNKRRRKRHGRSKDIV